MLLSARAPVLVAGPELATRDAFAEAAELAELLGAAVHAGPVPYSAQFPTAHPAYLGALTRSTGWPRNNSSASIASMLR